MKKVDIAKSCKDEDKVEEVKPIPRRAVYPGHEADILLGISKWKRFRLQAAGKLRFVVIGGERMTPHEEIERVAREGAPLLKGEAA